MAEKLEFGSRSWVNALGEIAQRLVQDADLSGVDFSFCEEYTDPPRHLLESDTDRERSVGSAQCE